MTNAEKQVVLNFINAPPTVRDLLGNRLTAIPQAPQSIAKTLQDCVSHLFDRTAKIVAVEIACNDTLINFSRDIPLGTQPGMGLSVVSVGVRSFRNGDKAFLTESNGDRISIIFFQSRVIH